MSQAEQKVQDFINGDKEAFQEIYEQNYKKIYFTCFSFLKDENDAEDITQDVFETVYTQIHTLKEPGKFQTWISTIAVNKCKNYLKKCKPVLMETESMEEFEESNELLLPQEYVINKAKRSIIREIMKSSLSDVLYQTAVLHYYNELSVSEIAQIMECPEGTVKYRLNAVRNRVKAGVEAYEKKSGDKLYSVSLVPLLVLFFAEETRAMEINVPPYSADAHNAGGSEIVSATEKNVGNVVGTGGVMSTFKVKILIAVLSIILAGGGITALVMLNQKDNEQQQTSGRDNTATVASTADKQKETQQQSDESPEVKYESDKMELIYDPLAGRIKKMVGNGEALPFILADDTIYSELEYSFQKDYERGGGKLDYTVKGLDLVNAWTGDSDTKSKVFMTSEEVGKVTVWGTNLGIEYSDILVKDLTFNKDTDYIIEHTASELSVLSIAEAEVSYRQYKIKDDKSVSLIKEKTVVSYACTNAQYDSSYIREIVSMPCWYVAGGYQHYILTNDNKLYLMEADSSYVEDVNGGCQLKLNLISENADKVFASAEEIRTQEPMYSRVGDSHNLYTKKSNYDVTYVMPDGHTVDDVKQVLGTCSGTTYSMLVVEFNNGDIYYSNLENKEIGKKITQIRLTKSEELTKLNAEGHIIAIKLGSSKDSELEVLMDDNSMYAIRETRSAAD